MDVTKLAEIKQRLDFQDRSVKLQVTVLLALYRMSMCEPMHVVKWHCYRALKSREISRENTAIFAHMWHQHSLLGLNQSRPLTLNDHWQSKAIKVAW